MWHFSLLFSIASGPALAPQDHPVTSTSTGDAPQALPTAVEPPQFGAALAFADWSGDGRRDALALQPDGAVLLLEAREDGTFDDRTAASGLAEVRNVHAAAWTDVDGDGDLDLYLAAWRGQSRLFLQVQSGLFEDRTEGSGLSPHLSPLTASFLDYDGDGRPDLHLVTEHDDLVFRNEGAGRFAGVRTGLLPRVRVPGAGLSAAADGVGAPLAGPDAQGRPSAASRTGRPGSGVVSQGAAGTGVNATPGGPSNQALGMGGLCAGSIEDQATGSCLEASSTPQLGLLYPLSTAWFVSAAGRVGLGTTTPATSLHVVDGLSPAIQIERTGGAQVRATAFLSEGGIGTFNNTNFRLLTNNTVRMHINTSGNVGIGTIAATNRLSVSGAANVTGNLGVGVSAPAHPVDATGSGERVVSARNTATSGTAFGGHFEASSTLGAGVRGTSPNIGVEGEGTGPNGIGLFGSGAGRGIFAVNPSANGVTAEIIASGENAHALIGLAASPTGSTCGVQGIVFGAEGIGVVGRNTAGTGSATGVKGTGVFGVLGEGTVGTLGISVDPTNGGIGVFGQSNGTTGGIGVTGQTQGTDGRGVYGNAFGAARYGVYGEVQATNGYAGYFIGRGHFSGNLGVGTETPSTRLDVRTDSTNANVVNLERTTDSTSGSDILQIRMAATSSDTSQFIECERGVDIKFRVNGDGNVTADGSFTGGGADFAEWLERRVPSERLMPGDVVGVFGGRITRTTAGAEHVLVVSTDPCLVGNGAGAENGSREGFEQVAFIGQVPVRVRGKVAVGDLLVPSGAGDGTAYAVAPAALAGAQLSEVFATAWEAHDGAGEALVNAAVGVDQARAATRVVAALEARVAAQARALAELTEATRTLTERIAGLEQR